MWGILLPLLAGFALSFLVCIGLLAALLRFPATGLLDQPNQRSLHHTAIPRVGGLALIPGALAGWSFVSGLPGGLALLVGGLAALSFVDDRRGLPPPLRLAAHLLAAGVWVGLALPLPNLAWAIVAVLAIAWMTNLYNFMDGSNGLAGGMAVIGFGAYAAAAYMAGNLLLAGLCGSVAAAAAGFLLFNFDPAWAFLGDAGSVPLGFLAGALGLYGAAQGLWPYWWPVMVFAPFVVDATTTLLRRAWRRERVWEAHREHYYQRLIRMGWSHRRTALVEYAWMAACAAGALLALHTGVTGTAVLAAIMTAFHVVAMSIIDRRWRTHLTVTAQ